MGKNVFTAIAAAAFLMQAGLNRQEVQIRESAINTVPNTLTIAPISKFEK